MAYIGKEPVVGNFQVCDAISVVNGQAAYSLTVAGAAVNPESANHMLVSLNGVLQKPGSSFTISGSTMTFASNLATGDVIDFVQILGNVLDLGQPSDDTVKTASLQANAVTGAKLNTDVISAQTALTSAPADTDEFLVSDAGTIKRIDYSLIKSTPTHTLLATTTASDSAQVDFSSDIDNTYRAYMVDIVDVRPATNDTVLYLRFLQGGSVDTGSVYDWVQDRVCTDSNINTKTGNTNDSRIELTYASNNSSNGSLNGRIFIYDPSNTAIDTYARAMLTYHIDGDKVLMMDSAGRIEETAAVDGFRFVFSSGNITDGVFKLYGIT